MARADSGLLVFHVGSSNLCYLDHEPIVIRMNTQDDYIQRAGLGFVSYSVH